MAIASIIATIVGVYDTYRDRIQATNLQLRTQNWKRTRTEAGDRSTSRVTGIQTASTFSV